MRKISTLLMILFTVGTVYYTYSQTNNLNQQSNEISEKYRNPDSPVDNNGFWKELIKAGIAETSQPIPFKPAENTDPRTGGPIDQMTTDICIWDETNVTQSENSIYIMPTDNETILNSNNSESGGGIYGANYLNSTNAGQTWTGSKFGAGGSNWGDPAACIGSNGRRYIGFITSSAGQGISYSDNGTTWTSVTISTVPSSISDLLDKNHLMVDTRASGTYSGYVYSAWSRFQSGHVNDNDLEFSRSTNNGVTWSTPINISNAIAAGNHNQGVNIQTGPSGQVYCTWVVYDNWSVAAGFGETAIGFARSLNGGASFYAPVRIHNNILGIRPRPSTATTNPTGKNMRCNSFPSMAVDKSNGYIYIVWSNVGVPGTNTGTNVSVYCMRSTNGGVSWGTPVRVNQGTTANDYAAFFPWITCDPSNGRLYCVYYDDRNLGSTSSALETWCSASDDGGLTWTAFRVGDVSFTPAPISGLALGYFGDYLGIDARDNWVYPTWTDNRSGRALTYVSPIQFDDYCIAASIYNAEHIANVSIGSINNASGYNGFENFTDLSTNLPVNGSELLTVENSTASYPSDQCGVWVDWNRDGDFNDANEEIAVSGTPGPGDYTATIEPPVGTTLGACTMRIRLTYTGAVDPCGVTSYGEVEDYTLIITAAEPNVWDGSFNHYWHNANNWSLNRIPIAIDPVEIPNVGYQPVYVDNYGSVPNEECASLLVGSGAALTFYDMKLIVDGDMTINGELSMTDNASVIDVMGNVVWESGSTWNVSANSFINVYKDWDFRTGANANATQGFVDFKGTTTEYIRCYSTNSSFYNVWNSKTGGAILGISAQCTQDVVVNNLLFTYSGTILNSYSPNDIVIHGFFNYYGDVDFSSGAGALVFDGTNDYMNNYSSGSAVLNDLVISSSTGMEILNGDIEVAGNITVEEGIFHIGTNNILLRGNWTNTSGVTDPGTGTVVFESSGNPQDVNGTCEFYNIQQINVGEYLRFYGPTTITNNLDLNYRCWAYDLMTINGTLIVNEPVSRFGVYSGGNANVAVLDQGGEIAVSGSTLTVGDLLESGIEGTHHLLSGELTLNQPSGFADLNGTIIINDGVMNVNGSGYSYWPYTNNASITMSGGILDMNNSGIRINNSATYSLTDNITGGVIRTASGFIGERSDFTPAAGLFEFYGISDASLSQSNGCTLYNVNMDKSADKSSLQGIPIIPDERDKNVSNIGGKSILSPEANTTTLTSDFVVSNDFSISGGVLNTSTFDMYVGGDWSNTVGPAAFVENTNTVFMDGPNDGDILTEETFYNLTVNKSNANFTALEAFQNVTVSNLMHIVDGVYEMNAGSNLILGNDVIIESGAGLNANDAALNIYVGGNWTNYNVDYDIYHGFWHGYISTVIFNNAGNNILTTSAPQEDFYNLTVYKAADQFRSNDNIQVFGKLLLFDGEWNDNVFGLTHTFHGDFEVTNNAAWFTHVNSNTVVFTGLNDQDLTYDHIGVGYFYDVVVNKVAADKAMSSSLDPSGTQENGENNGAKAQMLSMLTDIDIQLGGTLTIDEGTMQVNGNTLRGDGNIIINAGGTLSLNSNSTLWIDDGAELNVNGGLLESLGTPGNMAHITHRNTGYYAFEIENGGTISSEYTNFQYMNGNGLWIKPTGLIDPVHTFHNCTFQNGTSGYAPLLWINNAQVLTCNNVNFPQTGVSDYNVAKNVNTGEVNMVNATGSFEGETYEFDTYGLIHWTYTARTLALTVFLEGPYNSGTDKMDTDINGILPLNQPYGPALPYYGNPLPDWYYAGSENVGSIPNVFVVDWILVQLRDATSAVTALPATTFETIPAFVLNTGEIVALDGVSPLSFTGTPTNDLFVAIWHRNHLGVLSASALVDVGGVYTYDFSAGSGQAYGGTSAQTQLSTTPVIWGLMSGDGDGNGFIGQPDKLNVWNTQAGESGYKAGDFNLDGQVNNPDKDDYWVPNFGADSYIPE